jgi:ATP-binding cassette subfamily C protein EexD
VAQWDRENLGQFMGYVPQQVQLFDASVAENICRMGEPDSDAVVDAARRAAAHELILRLPQGYETRLADQGVSLSGGQRQRIGLARALYGRPRIVVMDEPNTHLDDQGLAALVLILKRLKEESCTVLLIVHQEALLTYADRVLKLDQGRIVYDGDAKVYRAEGAAS